MSDGYQTLLALLESLPEDERLLGAGTYYTETDNGAVCACALGAGAAIKSCQGLGYWIDMAEPEEWIVYYLRDVVGIEQKDQLRISTENDLFRSRSLSEDACRERYTHMVNWLRTEVAERASNPGAAVSPGLKSILRELESLPEDLRMLGVGEFYAKTDTGVVCGCALGAAAQSREKSVPRMWRVLPEYLTQEFGVNTHDIRRVSAMNDEFRPRDASEAACRERYAYMVDWIKSEVGT